MPRRHPETMDIKTFTENTPLPNTPADLLAIDLEMANSFYSSPAVICMIGVEYYDPEQAVTRATIASITDREEEADLIRWLLDHMEEFHRLHPAAKLLTFSGLDNDMRWLNERLVRLDIQAPEDSIFTRFGDHDLKVEFYRRTQNIKISLKKLEGIFGIDRASSITSKKVSYVLTDVVRNHQRKSEIPARLYEYLREDVHNLLVIYDRWNDVGLDNHNLTDGEFDELLTSLSRALKKIISGPRFRKSYKKEINALGEFLMDFDRETERSREAGSFNRFSLPDFPPARVRFSDYERIVKKYHYLRSVQVNDPNTGAYRLKKQIFRPKGALAVVRDQGRVLMIRRSKSVERAPGFWGLPGGAVEEGETPAACAVRELREEVNLEGRVVEVLGESESFSGEYQLSWVELVVNDFSPMRPDPSEVAIIRWVPVAEVGELKPLIPGAVEGFEKFLSGE